VALRDHNTTIPLVVLTGQDDAEVASAVIKLGAQDFLVKGSFEQDALARTLRHALERHQTQREQNELLARLAEANEQLSQLAKDEQAKSTALNAALVELKNSQEMQVRTEKLAAIGQLAASVSHELRNPLAAVRGATAYMRKRFDDGQSLVGDPRVGQLLSLVDRELNACMKIISDLLDLARERPLVLAPCPLHMLTDEAIELLPPHKITIKNRVPTDLPMPSVDKDQFRQILVNLVQNAVEAMPGDKGEVVVLAETNAGESGDPVWRLSVQDDGPGIPPDVASRIFEPLFTTKAKGTGLGLAIVSTVVKRHGGAIRVETEPGKGTKFIVELSRVNDRRPKELS
jgi:signal transduction histidine kinase